MIDYSTNTDDHLKDLSILAAVNLFQHTLLPERQIKSMTSGILKSFGAAGSAQSSVACFIEVIARSAVSSSLVYTSQDQRSSGRPTGFERSQSRHHDKSAS